MLSGTVNAERELRKNEQKGGGISRWEKKEELLRTGVKNAYLQGDRTPFTDVLE